MRIFKHFPKDATCKICGTNEDKECVLVPIDGTQNGMNREAVPTHVECIQKDGLRFNRELGIFYREKR